MNGSTIMLFLNVLLFIAVTFLTFVVTGEGGGKISEWIKKRSMILRTGLAAAFLILFIVDVSGIVKLGGYRFISLWGIAFSGVSAAAELKISEKFRFILNFLMRSVSVCLILELFIFNMNSAHIMGERYSKQTLDLSAASYLNNIDPETGMNSSAGEVDIEFKELNIPIATITVSAESSLKGNPNFAIDMTDDTNSGSYRYDIASIQTIYGNKRSQTAPMNFSGNVHDLRIRCYPKDGEIITISAITVNKPIMLHFSIIRFMIMLFGSLAVFALSSAKIFRCSYEERRKAVRICAWCFTAVLIGGALFMTNMARYRNENHSISADLMSTGGNQISQEIVDAFEKGQLYLWEAGEDLVNLENPYDWSQRGSVAYPWDHLLFEGKIYSYYGIGPVIALFLPYHMITGYYFPTSWACFLFAAFGIFFLTKMWLNLCDKFFRRTDGSLILLGLTFMQLSTGICFCIFDPNFYEIAQSSGFLCVAGGAYFLVSSNVIGEGKIKNWRIAVSGIFLSMGVLCRPTLAVYCLAAMIFVYAGFKKLKNSVRSDENNIKQHKTKLKKYILYSICAFLPYVVIGSVQMWYNYARFGSLTDFGIQYSLTINDFTASEYHTHFALIGFFNYLLAMPAFRESFPFFSAEYPHSFSPQGYYFIATGSAMGLLWRAAPILAYVKSRTAYKLTAHKDKKLFAVMIAAVCIACPFAVIYSIWESGYGTRYCVDFAWQLILGALVICYIIHGRAKENSKKHLNSLMIIAAILGLVMNYSQLNSYFDPTSVYNAEWSAKAMEFARLFEFWR